MLATNSSTVFSIKDHKIRWFWIFYNLLILVSSLTGDPLILLATIKHNAVKLHRVILVIMQHLALCDLILSVFRVFPTIVALIVDTWILGDVWCRVEEHVASVCTTATVGLTVFLSICKSLTVWCPLRTRTWSRRNAHKLSALIWGFCLVSPTQVTLLYVMVVEPVDTVYFNYISYTCDYNYTLTPHWLGLLTDVYLLVGVTTAYLILLASSVYLLLKAVRRAAQHERSVPWQGMLAIALTAVTLVLSFLPYNVMRIISQLDNFVDVELWRAVIYFQNINIMANFFIYSLTVPSFRKFLRDRFRALVKRTREYLTELYPLHTQVSSPRRCEIT